jgi:hypothetical protein
MVDYTDCKIEDISIHSVGNKTREEELILSRSKLDNIDPVLRNLLHKFFLTPFADPEFYAFTSTSGDFVENPVFRMATRIFEDEDALHENSVSIATLLYELAVHPHIKSGDLFVVKFSDVQLGDEITDAIGIFKSENKQQFLKLDRQGPDFSMHYDEGMHLEKLDKGCLIFNVDKSSGYKVCIVDKSARSGDAQYWKDTFLQLAPCHDDYHQTKAYMHITKDFVSNQLVEDFDVHKTDQIELLNRSANYFKTHDKFDKGNFEAEVLHEAGVIASVRTYNEQSGQHHGVAVADQFDISQPAVKKQGRVFKSVLKLDKNFHIYIHGDRNLIEHGIDQDGRKFYKIYFQNET